MVIFTDNELGLGMKGVVRFGLLTEPSLVLRQETATNLAQRMLWSPGQSR